MSDLAGFETSIQTQGSSMQTPLCTLLSNALTRALALDCKLPDAIINMHGMSGRKYRRLINNLVSSVPDARYLEIGSWMGSTACSAMFLNKATVTCIDNWSEFGGPKDVFLNNIGIVQQHFHKFSFRESDFRSVDYSEIGKYNIYLFDGPHEYGDQFDGVMIAQDALDDEYVLIVDDWNYERVRSGTMDALRKATTSVLYSIDIRTTQNGAHTKDFGENSDWHNGYFVAVLKKNTVATPRAKTPERVLELSA